MYRCPLSRRRMNPQSDEWTSKTKRLNSYFEFYSEVQDILIPLAQVAGPIFGAALVAWVKERPGRKVRLKFDGVNSEVRSPEQVENLLEQANIFRERKRKPGNDP